MNDQYASECKNLTLERSAAISAEQGKSASRMYSGKTSADSLLYMFPHWIVLEDVIHFESAAASLKAPQPVPDGSIMH